MRKYKKIRLIVKRPEDPVGQVREVENSLKALQELVGGYIECVRVGADVVIICNEESVLEGLPLNCTVCGASFVGTIIAAGTKGERFTSCPVTLEDWAENYIGEIPFGVTLGK